MKIAICCTTGDNYGNALLNNDLNNGVPAKRMTKAAFLLPHLRL